MDAGMNYPIGTHIPTGKRVRCMDEINGSILVETVDGSDAFGWVRRVGGIGYQSVTSNWGWVPLESVSFIPDMEIRPQVLSNDVSGYVDDPIPAEIDWRE
jgi:hypothetical protein